MSKNLFESLQTAASATHTPISCSSYGQQSDSGDLVIHEETQNDEEEDDLLDLVLGINESTGNYVPEDCTKSANSDSANANYEAKQANNSVNETTSIRRTMRNERDFCPSILMNECSTSPLLSSQDVVSSSDSSSRSLDKNIWKQLAGKSMLPQASMSLPDNEDGDKHSSRSSIMEISERGPPRLSPIQNSLSGLTQLDISKSVSDSRSSKLDNVDYGTAYIQRKDVEVGPLVECISEKPPIVEQSTGQMESVAESMRSRIDRKTDSYSIESGEIFSSEDGDSVDDGTKELLIDVDAEEEEEDSDVFGNENEETAEETEDTEWCSETTQPLSEDSDEDTERASIDSEMNNLVIAFPDASEESPLKNKDDTEACCIEEEIQEAMETCSEKETVEICSDEKEAVETFSNEKEAVETFSNEEEAVETFSNEEEAVETFSDEKETMETCSEEAAPEKKYDSTKETETDYLSATKEPSDSDVHYGKESEEIKLEPIDEEVSIVEEEVKEVYDLTGSQTIVKKEEIPTRPSNRQVSFFEKAADLLCLNLFDNSDVYLSSPTKSVFSSFVKSEAISEEEPTDSSNKNPEVSTKADDTSKNTESKVSEVSKSPKSLDVPQTSLLYESCSVNELLLKEEEEEEDEEEREGQEPIVYKTAGAPLSSQGNLSVLGNIVDRPEPGKEEDSRLSLISKRLRNRMPHWDDSFNEAFVPQIRTKPPTVGASSSSASNHNSSDSHKRSKAMNQSSEMQFRSVSHETYRDPITFVPQHVKKVRQFLTALNVCQDKVEDDCEGAPSEEAVVEHKLSSLKMGSPNPKTTALRARKHSYHDSKKALRLPQKLIRSLPSPTVVNSEEAAPETAAPGPSAPSTSMEFRSSLGASVRTKPRAFTKAALRRQIIEEASTAKPQFRVKTRPTSDDGTGALAIVITRVSRPPHAKRSFSSDPRVETDNLGKADSMDEKSTAMSVESSKDFAPDSNDGRQGGDGQGFGDCAAEVEQKDDEAGNSSEMSNASTKSSGEKRKLEETRSKSNEASTTCSADAQDGTPKRRRRDSDSSATSSSRDRNTPINFANASYQSSTRASSQSPPKNVSGKNDARNTSNADDTQSQSFDEDALCRDAVNFRGVASNRKRLKGQKKPRLLQEIENTSGFLMDQSKTDNREQRALERLLLKNAELQSGNNSGKRADSSVHSSPRVLLDRLSPDQIKRRGRIRSKQRRNFSQREPRRDCRNPKPDSDPRKPKNTVNVAAANRITAKYAAAKIDRARDVASVHPRVRALIRRTSGRDVYGRTALHLAAALGQLDSVLYCLKLNVDLNEHDHSGLYPIHAASRNGNVAVIQALLEAGADVNMCAGAEGISPLHEAASGGKMDAVRELVARGADRTLTLYDGTTAADCAENEDIRGFLEGNEPASAPLPEVEESAPAVDEDKFELYDRSPPLVFTIWLESTKKKSEVLLLSELCDFCGLDKVSIRVHKPFVHIVKVSMQQLHRGMRNNFLWPALRLRLRVEGSLLDHKSFENPSQTLIALVLYTDQIRALTGGIGISLSKEEVERVKDPPTPPKPVRNPQPVVVVQKEKVDGVPVELRSAAVSADVVKKESCVRPPPVIKADSPQRLPARPVGRSPAKSHGLAPGDAADSDGSSDTDGDVVITGIFSAPKRPPALPAERNFAPEARAPLPRKRPVASVIPSRVQPQTKSRRLSQESESDPDRLLLREEYEQIKLERLSLEKKELQLRERILEMADPRRHRARRPSDDKPRALLPPDAAEDGRRFPASSQPNPVASRPRVSPTLIPMSSVAAFKDLGRSQSSDVPEAAPPSASNPLQRLLPAAVTSRPAVLSPETSRHLPTAVVYDSLVVKKPLGAVRMPLQKAVERPCITVTSAPQFSAAAPGGRVPRLPQPSALRSKVVPSFPKFDHVYAASVPTTVRPAAQGRPATEAVGRLAMPRFIPVSIPSSPLFVTRVLPSNPNLGPPAAVAPSIEVSEAPSSNSASRNDLPCSPPGSPPLLVPQGPVAVQGAASRVSPAPNAAPPLLFPQEPPVLLPCPKIADTTYPGNNGRVEAPERDEAPPLLIPSNPPPIRGVKCASELLKKRSSSAVAPSIPNKVIPPRVSEGLKKSVTVTSPDVIGSLPNEASIPLKKTTSDIAREREASDRSRIRLKLPPPILTSPETRRLDIPSDKCAAIKSLVGSVTHSFLSNQRCESSQLLSKPMPASIKEKLNLSRASVLKLNSDRRRKIPLIRFHSDGQTISIRNQVKKVNEAESFNHQCIDLTKISPPGTPVIE